ncbi:MAG: rim15, signal transduction response regulator [Peltula sp. TS41687]|nr:MAG: rim15, signal transduction response regulator [Peltula sp. TS41687]
MAVPEVTSPLDMALNAETPSGLGLRMADENQSEPPLVEVGQMMTREIREGAEELKEAVQQTLNIILDLAMDGIVRWVSPSWADVVGTPPDSIQGKPIADVLLDDKSIFADAVQSLKRDDSRSQTIRFSVRMGPLSKLPPHPSDVKGEEDAQAPGEHQVEEAALEKDDEPVLTLEGQGIMVYDRSSGGESHTMWMVRPPIPPREITIDLPAQLVDSLGVGVEMLEQYLTALAESGVEDPANYPPPPPELCRICERQIQPWWFEKHTDLCAQEHRAEMEVQLTQEILIDHRDTIVRLLDALAGRSGRPMSSENAMPSPPLAEYKGIQIGQWSPPSSAVSSGTTSPTAHVSRSREQSTAGLGRGRTGSFVNNRRPLARNVELVLDLCDTAIGIDISANRESSSIEGNDADHTSKIDTVIMQVLQWQPPGTITLEQERGIAALCADTQRAARTKVEAILRHRRIVEYAERIRVEYSVIVQDCVEAAMRKAARLVAGESSESSDDEEDEVLSQHSEPVTAHASVHLEILPDDPLRSHSDPTLDMAVDSSESMPISTASSSPRECLTPKSHRESYNGYPAQTSKRSSMFFESDVGESDSSIRSSIISGLRRTESPAPEYALSRASSRRDRNSRSILLPELPSQLRQPSSPKDGLAQSPLKLNKLRISNSQETAPSPVTSPLLTGGEICLPAPYPNSYPLPNQHHYRHNHHHRRQSSATSAEVMRPLSPHLTSLSPAQTRAVPPSIKDFEIIKPISKGAFGSVYLAKKKSTGDYYAIKVLKKADMVAKNQVTNVKAERAIMMRQGESDYVAKLYWTFSSKDYLYLVMEYLNGGDCASLIKSLGGLPEDWAKRYVAEVVVCVEDLHKRGIVHRDLKPDNLLIDQKGHLKLTDFGLSRMGLIGRQKRVLNSEANDSVPDLLKQGPFLRPTSVTSSRSASFDIHGNQSPGSTPSMTPDIAAGLAQPSYFSLGRDYSNSRDQFRLTSRYRSDSGGSETLQAMFSSFTLAEPATFSVSSRNSRIGEEGRSEVGEESPDLYPLQPMDSQSSIGLQRATPPQNSMMPPPLALFDPDDNSRRFVGTPDYLAPETINGVGQDEMSDWWSLGCILFEALYGYPPFHADTPDQVFENILQRRIDWPRDEDFPVSPEAKDIMHKLMCSDPRERLGANRDRKFASGGEEIKRHPWFDGVNWDTLFQDEAQFVPAPEHPEDTEYFDSRGASLQTFTEEYEDQVPSPAMTPGVDDPNRPHDALFSRVIRTRNSLKRSLLPLHIPPHVRDNRTRRLSEPVPADDFGAFSFKNLPVLEKANKDVIRKLRAEVGQCHSRTSSLGNPSIGNSPTPSIEGSPTTKQMSLKRQSNQDQISQR